MIHRNKIQKMLELKNNEYISRDTIEQIKKVDLESGCETVCGMISEFFDYIRTETVEI